MASHSQTMTEPAVTTFKKGGSSTSRMNAVYASSPMYKGDVDDASQKAEYQKVLDEQIQDNGTFGTFDPNYSDAPDIKEGSIGTGGGGLPASAWVPNPVSPGEGSMLASDQAAAPEGYGQNPNAQFGAGADASARNPKDTSLKTSAVKLGEYLSGKAYE